MRQCELSQIQRKLKINSITFNEGLHATTHFTLRNCVISMISPEVIRNNRIY